MFIIYSCSDYSAKRKIRRYIKKINNCKYVLFIYLWKWIIFLNLTRFLQLLVTRVLLLLCLFYLNTLTSNRSNFTRLLQAPYHRPHYHTIIQHFTNKQPWLLITDLSNIISSVWETQKKCIKKENEFIKSTVDFSMISNWLSYRLSVVALYYELGRYVFSRSIFRGDWLKVTHYYTHYEILPNYHVFVIPQASNIARTFSHTLTLWLWSLYINVSVAALRLM